MNPRARLDELYKEWTEMEPPRSPELDPTDVRSPVPANHVRKQQRLAVHWPRILEAFLDSGAAQEAETVRRVIDGRHAGHRRRTATSLSTAR